MRDAGSDVASSSDEPGAEPDAEQPASKQNVLVTGATGTIGRQLVHVLYHDERIHRILAVARDPEPYYFHDCERHRFQYKQVDILKTRELNNLFLSETFRQAEVDTVIHLAFLNRPAERRTLSTHQLNVEGTKNLLDRCLEVGHVRKFVFQSSDCVYKVRAANPILIDEEADLNFDPDASQYVKDRVDADMICRAQLGNEHMRIVILRPSSIIGRNVHSHWNALLENHYLIFKVLGYDPMICPTHANDVLRALQHVVHKHVHGVFNISGIDVAPLSVFIRLCNAHAVPLPAFLVEIVNRVQLALRLTQYDYSALPECLLYHTLLDTTRAKTVLGFTSQYHIKFG